jgi:chloramphenicol-sensitive protein RarD
LSELPTPPQAVQKRGPGFAAGVAAYVLWGLFPIYFHYLKGKVTPTEILVHRIIWSVPVVALLLAYRDGFLAFRTAAREPRTMLLLAVSACLIAFNWLLFVVAIVEDQLVEASLGYFINPLVSVALGMIFLRERLNRLQTISLLLVVVGVGYLVVQGNGVPWLALGLAFSFGLYGLTRKQVNVDSPSGFFWETVILFPFALAYLLYTTAAGYSRFSSSPEVAGMLVLAGPLTAAPLILYTVAVRLLPLSTMGFLQYIAPSLQFALAVYAFGEPFDRVRFTAFAFIWTAVAIFVADVLRRVNRAGDTSRESV